MFYFFIYFLVSLALTSILLFCLILGWKFCNHSEKVSPFECGFDPVNNTRIPFSIKFFLLAVIFLVFDIEVTLILPFLFCSIHMFWFVILLVAGLSYEWLYGGLDWIM